MSADSSLVFYGLKFAIADEQELDALEARTHPLQLKAKAAGLDHYWGNTAVEEYALFIGRRLGLVGVQNKSHVEISPEEMAGVDADVVNTFRKIGLEGDPKLHIQMFPD